MKFRHKFLLEMTLILLVFSITLNIAFSNGNPPSPQALDWACYQEKCKAEKDLWDDANSKCIFTPKSYYVYEYFRENYNEDELRAFLDKKLDPDKKRIILVYTQEEGYPLPYTRLLIEHKELLLEFQCNQVGFTLGSENCDKSLIDNFRYLAVLDKDFLKSDLSLNQKNRISDIYDSCLKFGIPKEPEQQREEKEQQRKEKKFLLISLLLFLFIIGGIILGNWIYHIKEKKSSDYLIHGVLGFFIGVMHIFISFFISYFVVGDALRDLIPERGLIYEFFLLPHVSLILLLGGGFILEFMFYKKTKRLFWIYSLTFGVLMMLYIIISNVHNYIILLCSHFVNLILVLRGYR